jgi:hypothetical protein
VIDTTSDMQTNDTAKSGGHSQVTLLAGAGRPWRRWNRVAAGQEPRIVLRAGGGQGVQPTGP